VNSRGRLLLWLVPGVLYGAFWYWYTPLGGPLTPTEIEAVVTRLEQGGGDPARIARLRAFMENDDGRHFVMVNYLDMADVPPTLPATGPGATADDLMNHYMEHMYRELFKRACHPVFAGTVVHSALDLAGIDGADEWTRVGLVRYRSRRDMIEIATDPAFGERHDYKIGALDKTIAVPVSPDLYLSDPRFLLALILLAVVACLDVLLFSRRGTTTARVPA